MEWNESSFRPPLCTYRPNWARRTSWGWWDEWDDTVVQTQDSKFKPWRSVAEHANSRSRRLPTILSFTRGWGRNIFVSFKQPRPGTEPQTLAWKAAVLTTTLGPPPLKVNRNNVIDITSSLVLCNITILASIIFIYNIQCGVYINWTREFTPLTFTTFVYFILFRFWPIHIFKNRYNNLHIILLYTTLVVLR